MDTKRILELEKLARCLEPDASQRDVMRQEVVSFGEQFIESLSELPAYIKTEEEAAGLYQTAISEEGKATAQLLSVIQEHLVEVGINGAGGGHLGYIPVSSLYGAALGDYLAAVINRYSSLFYASPGSVRMANQLLRWMAELIGFSTDAGGNLTTSGSMAHLIGIVTAREVFSLKARDFDKVVVYLNEHTHLCVDKALRIAGLGECIRRYIGVDDQYRMDPDLLARTIAEDRNKGLQPWMLVANAGSTDTGTIDPLDALGEIAHKHGLWYQIDAAYGGFFLLCEGMKERMKGIERADAVVLDPHKGLFIPAGLGAIVVADARLTRDAMSFEANYLQEVIPMPEEPSPAEMSPELTQHFRAMRLWFPLQYHGVAAFRAALEEKLALSQYAWERLNAAGFEMCNKPDLSVFAFRRVPKTGDADPFNEALHQCVEDDGRVFLTTTRLKGNYVIRMAILSYRTHLDTVDRAIDLLISSAKQLEQDLSTGT